MMDRIALVRPFTGEVIHPHVDWETGSDTPGLTRPGDVTFRVDLSWHEALAEDQKPYFMDRGTLVVVEQANREIRAVGLVDGVDPQDDALEISCGGFSMTFGQSGAWEGHQGYFVQKDPVSLFRDIVGHVQTYPDSNLGIRVVGDTSSGSSLGYPGSARWQNVNRQLNRYRPELQKWEGRMVTRERIMFQRTEALFDAVGLKRVGNVNVSDNEPDDPGYRADSTIWIRESTGRAFAWRGGRWVSQSQADDAVRQYLSYQGTVERGKEELERLRYLVGPLEDRLEELEDEGREEYSLYFWQNHDINQVIEELTQMGSFEYREEAAWRTDSEGKTRLDLMLRVGAPTVGVRRPELHLEMGVNVLDRPPEEYGETYTGVTLFGAGEGSEVLSTQVNIPQDGVVRNILVETDKDALTQAQAREAANQRAKELRKAMGLHISELRIYHDEDKCPLGSFQVGDQIPVTGELSNGKKMTRWHRVLDATHPWGSNYTQAEVEPV